jgi:hypothetical protein
MKEIERAGAVADKLKLRDVVPLPFSVWEMRQIWVQKKHGGTKGRGKSRSTNTRTSEHKESSKL